MEIPRSRQGMDLSGQLPVRGSRWRSLREFRNNAPEFLERVAREHGDLGHVLVGRQHIYVLSDPDAIREVLVTQQNKFKKSRMLERGRVLLGDGRLASEGPYH